MRILIAEDEPDMNRLIVKKLKKEGYAVDACFDGEEAWELLTLTSYDLAVLDIMMPKKSGLALVKQLRAHKMDVPVLFLTARDSIDDKVEGLDCGANDYLVKPFAFRELLARIRVLTRGTMRQNTARYELEELIVDTGRHQVWRGGQQIELSAREFAVLEYLICNAGTVLSRETIENHVWDYGYEGSSNMIDVHIHNLRKKSTAHMKKS